MKAGLIQYSPQWENKKQNMYTISEVLESCYNREDLLIFPEMSLTGFTMKAKEFAEDIDGESIQFFMDTAKKFKTHVMAGIIEKVDEQIYNSLFHFDQNGLIIARYRKIHLFSPSGENSNYVSANEQVITKIGQTKIGLSICYDLRFPELYRHYARERVDLIINIASWPTPRYSHWITLLQARAIENQCFVIGVNRIGNDPNLSYNGCSCVFDPMGKEIVLVKDKQELISVELEINEVEKIREQLPFLNDMKML